MKRAVIVAAAVVVVCPYCGEPHPSPDNGADTWLPQQLAAEDSRQVTCTSCDKDFLILHQNRVSLDTR